MKTEELIETTQGYIDAMCSEERANDLSQLLNDIGAENYFTAPGSSRESYHDCYPGGLAEHNIIVLQNLVKLNSQFKLGFSDESVCVVSILHDIGKAINTDFKPFYTVCEENWKQKKGEKYVHDFGSIYLPTHQRTMWVCHHFGFKLSVEEYQAILLNDGQYIQENKGYSFKECNLAKALHMADMLSLMQEKKNQTAESV